MGKLTLTARHRKAIAATGAVLTVLVAANLFLQMAGYVKWRRWAADHAVLASPATQPASQPASTQAAASQSAQGKPAEKRAEGQPREADEALKKRSLFAPPKPLGHGLSLSGVLGNMAMFRTRDGKSVTIEEGKSERGVKVKSIDTYVVTIEYEGKPETMKLFDGSGSGPPVVQTMPLPGPGAPPGGPMPMPMPGAVVVPGQGPPMGGRMVMPEGIDASKLPPEIRKRMKRAE
jgi:hypothetical protein